MKIAAVSDDGTAISEHFGRAPYYVVLTVEGANIVHRELRAKTGHHTFAGHRPPKLAEGERHGYDRGAQSRHESMAETISDCQVVLAGGMGWGAYERLRRLGIEAVLTDVLDAQQAARLYLEGRLPNLMERLH